MRAPAPQFLYPALRARPVRRILIVKLRAIGDVLLSTVVLRSVRAAFPDAEIDYLTEAPARDIVEGHPALTRTLIFDPRHDSFLSLLRQIYRARYDLVFDLFCNPRSAQITFATRAPVRVGYPFRGRAYAYTVHVPVRSDRVHNTEFNLDALAVLQIPITDRALSFAITPDADRWAADLLAPYRAEGKMLVALNPSGTWESKRWGLDHYAGLGDALAARYNAVPVIVWGPGEHDDALRVASLMQAPALVPPKTTLKQLGALLARCDGMVSNDTSPMHLGAAVGIPVLGVHGPTNPHLQGPFNALSAWVRNEKLECLACNYTECPIGNMCMTELSVDTVLAAFDSMLERARHIRAGGGAAL